MQTPESRVKTALKKYLKEIGAFAYMPVQTGYGAAGLDFFVCYKGRFYGIETKRPGVDEPTPRQKCCMREIAEAGGGTWVENSETLETTKRRLDPTAP
jgi:hypothetical protein